MWHSFRCYLQPVLIFEHIFRLVDKFCGNKLSSLPRTWTHDLLHHSSLLYKLCQQFTKNLCIKGHNMGDRRHVTGDLRQETGVKRQEMWDRRCETEEVRQEKWYEMWDRRHEAKDVRQNMWYRRCETGAVRQETEDVRQEKWDRRHETGDVRQDMWDRRSETGDMIQKTQNILTHNTSLTESFVIDHKEKFLV